MSYQSTILALSGLKAYYPLDETSGTVATDATGGGHDATYHGSPTLAVSPLIGSGTAVTFDGATQWADFAYSTLNSGATTLSVWAWIKTTSANLQEIICADESSGSRYFQFRTSTTGKVQFTVFDNTASGFSYAGNITVNDGAPHFVMGVYDGSKIRIFVDGVEDGAGQAASFTLETTNPGFQIGRRYSGGTGALYFTGTIDEPAISTSDLSGSASAIYSAGTAVTESATVTTTTSLTAIENIDFIESSILNSKLTVTGSENVISDSSTVGTVTTPSGSDVYAHAPILDSATVPVLTSISSVDRGPFSDAVSVGTVTTPSTRETFVHPAGYWGPFDDDDGIIP